MKTEGNAEPNSQPRKKLRFSVFQPTVPGLSPPRSPQRNPQRSPTKSSIKSPSPLQSPKKSPLKSPLRGRRRSSYITFRDEILNKRIALGSRSNQFRENTFNIMTTINNIAFNMCSRFETDEKVIQNLSRTAMKRTTELRRATQKMQKINSEFIQNYYQTYTDKLQTEENSKKRKPSESEDNKDISYSDLSIVNHESLGLGMSMKKEEDIQKRLTQLHKIEKLKGEILIMNQRKKYNINKTFEEPVIFRKGDFLRPYQDNCKFKPYYKYNKENLHYKRNYFSPEKKSEGLFLSQDNEMGIKEKKSQKPVKIDHDRIKSASSKYTRTQLSGDTFYTTQVTSPYTRPVSNYRLFSGAKPGKPTATLTASNNKRKKYSSILTKVNKISMKASLDSQEISNLIKEEAKIIKEREDIKVNKTTSFDINRVIKDMGLDRYKSGKNHIDENEIIFKNKEAVGKKLDKKGKAILNALVNQLIFEQERLNKGYSEENTYTKKIMQLKQEKEFKRVSYQTTALKKRFNPKKSIEPENEKEIVLKIIKSLGNENLDDPEVLREILLKYKIMEDIKPLVYDKSYNKLKKQKVIRKPRVATIENSRQSGK